ncbi:outer membrane protein assembly factor BamE [Pseudoruegeria sp. SK021]|uniref:outer membrane protein assembly factor BamE n=1 Tax=Pseudoruegeria sp. SK021 TaxID=1933035 RepID=UPI000A22315D|nr:outer membrane protein assembly factor BamE [Pseudoruegeria sp. SK021]OSP54919.1 hypothetical protein BV911_09710 [Pseudoruegeria sp. SK021]
MANASSKTNFRVRSGSRILGLVIGMSVLSACNPTIDNHGYVPPPSELAKVVVGTDTRETVVEKIGAPINTGFDNNNAWYYVSSRRQNRGILPPKEIERQVLAIDFADAGQVTDIRRYGIEHGQLVVLTGRTTNPPVRDIGFLRSIFGNIGTPTAAEVLQ